MFTASFLSKASKVQGAPKEETYDEPFVLVHGGDPRGEGGAFPPQLFMEAWCFNALWKIALEESFDGRGIIIGMGSAAFASCARFSERKC